MGLPAWDNTEGKEPLAFVLKVAMWSSRDDDGQAIWRSTVAACMSKLGASHDPTMQPVSANVAAAAPDVPAIGLDPPAGDAPGIKKEQTRVDSINELVKAVPFMQHATFLADRAAVNALTDLLCVLMLMHELSSLEPKAEEKVVDDAVDAAGTKEARARHCVLRGVELMLTAAAKPMLKADPVELEETARIVTGVYTDGQLDKLCDDHENALESAAASAPGDTTRRQASALALLPAGDASDASAARTQRVYTERAMAAVMKKAGKPTAENADTLVLLALLELVSMYEPAASGRPPCAVLSLQGLPSGGREAVVSAVWHRAYALLSELAAASNRHNMPKTACSCAYSNLGNLLFTGDELAVFEKGTAEGTASEQKRIVRSTLWRLLYVSSLNGVVDYRLVVPGAAGSEEAPPSQSPLPQLSQLCAPGAGAQLNPALAILAACGRDGVTKTDSPFAQAMDALQRAAHAELNECSEAAGVYLRVRQKCEGEGQKVFFTQLLLLQPKTVELLLNDNSTEGAAEVKKDLQGEWMLLHPALRTAPWWYLLLQSNDWQQQTAQKLLSYAADPMPFLQKSVGPEQLQRLLANADASPEQQWLPDVLRLHVMLCTAFCLALRGSDGGLADSFNSALAQCYSACGDGGIGENTMTHEAVQGQMLFKAGAEFHTDGEQLREQLLAQHELHGVFLEAFREYASVSSKPGAHTPPSSVHAAPSAAVVWILVCVVHGGTPDSGEHPYGYAAVLDTTDADRLAAELRAQSADVQTGDPVYDSDAGKALLARCSVAGSDAERLLHNPLQTGPESRATAAARNLKLRFCFQNLVTSRRADTVNDVLEQLKQGSGTVAADQREADAEAMAELSAAMYGERSMQALLAIALSYAEPPGDGAQLNMNESAKRIVQEASKNLKNADQALSEKDYDMLRVLRIPLVSETANSTTSEAKELATNLQSLAEKEVITMDDVRRVFFPRPDEAVFGDNDGHGGENKLQIAQMAQEAVRKYRRCVSKASLEAAELTEFKFPGFEGFQQEARRPDHLSPLPESGRTGAPDPDEVIREARKFPVDDATTSLMYLMSTPDSCESRAVVPLGPTSAAVRLVLAP